jgi:hypothetical protein
VAWLGSQDALQDSLHQLVQVLQQVLDLGVPGGAGVWSGGDLPPEHRPPHPHGHAWPRGLHCAFFTGCVTSAHCAPSPGSKKTDWISSSGNPPWTGEDPNDSWLPLGPQVPGATASCHNCHRSRGRGLSCCDPQVQRTEKGQSPIGTRVPWAPGTGLHPGV